ncbi:ParB family protein [Marinagarivorans cellulosilyticus]|uniref:Uncharacterized protein n=1 Tax=Marinagarivorans cellulosilyticus TaxID=2721545 RepID=A0AAN2BK61_9GAMM|nr:ParB family protein [Marinagarivorans cellulosilyticus]BCD97666.1 hypothetical protein MARGE09_P1867 [Marinagarivorans cellulosilyticus]
MSKKIDYENALFGDNTAPIVASDHTLPPDPRVATRLPVTIDNLVPYAGNPRTTANPEYDAIKESIRYRGLDHPPNVTRESPDKPYMIKDGGNTRLMALKELWQETQDPRYFTIDCMFHPWVSERDVLLAHIIENEMRGKMTFIDRARAAMRLKEDLEHEGGEALSSRVLAEKITKLGWSLKHQHLSLMIYAFETLLPWLPSTLDYGMGRPAINSTKRLLNICRQYWDAVATPDEGNFDEVWQLVFVELDEEEAFSPDIARNRLEEAMAERLSIPLSSVRAEVQGLESGSSIEAQRPSKDAFTQHPDQEPQTPVAPPRPETPMPVSYAETTTPEGNNTPSGNPYAEEPQITGGFDAQVEHHNELAAKQAPSPALTTAPETVLQQNQAAYPSTRDYSHGGIEEALEAQRVKVIEGLRAIFRVFGFDDDVVEATDDPVMCFQFSTKYYHRITPDTLYYLIPFELALEYFGVINPLVEKNIGECLIHEGADEFMPIYQAVQGKIMNARVTVQYGLALKRTGNRKATINGMTFEELTQYAEAAVRWNEAIIEYTALVINDHAGLLPK